MDELSRVVSLRCEDSEIEKRPGVSQKRRSIRSHVDHENELGRRLARYYEAVNHLVAVVGIVFVVALLLNERISWLQGLGIFVGGVAWISVKGATKLVKGEQEWISDGTTSKTQLSSSSV